MKTRHIHIVLLAAVLILGSFLRFYKIAQIPPSLSWDEVSVGYNAWSIINWGADEWGRKFPLAFEAFGEYKLPVHIYITSIFVGVFGLNELGVRVPVALFGILNIYLLYLLASKFFKDKAWGLIAALFLAVSPYHIHFSRFNHELNFALFFFLTGVYLFLRGLEKKNFLVTLGLASLGLDLLTYNAAKIIVPPIFFLLVTIYFKDLWKVKKWFLLGVVSFTVFVGLFFIEPQLLGSARFKEISVSVEELQKTSIYEKTNSLLLGRLANMASKYKAHFTYAYLFGSGDTNPRLSSQSTGEFYKIDLAFLIVGLTVLVWGIIKKHNREYLLVLVWGLLAPIPATLSSEFPHAARAMFTLGSWHLITALGAAAILSIFKQPRVKITACFLLFLILGYFVKDFLPGYYINYPRQYAIEWQYGLKQVVEHFRDRPEYDVVYMTPERQQPYIFYLFYLKYPLPQYLKTVRYNDTRSRSANTVAGFGRYNFGFWDPIESLPIPYISYVVTPSQYNGLRYKLSFETLRNIKYPDGSDAFFVVSAKMPEQ